MAEDAEEGETRKEEEEEAKQEVDLQAPAVKEDQSHRLFFLADPTTTPRSDCASHSTLANARTLSQAMSATEASTHAPITGAKKLIQLTSARKCSVD